MLCSKLVKGGTSYSGTQTLLTLDFPCNLHVFSWPSLLSTQENGGNVLRKSMTVFRYRIACDLGQSTYPMQPWTSQTTEHDWSVNYPSYYQLHAVRGGTVAGDSGNTSSKVYLILSGRLHCRLHHNWLPCEWLYCCVFLARTHPFE